MPVGLGKVPLTKRSCFRKLTEECVNERHPYKNTLRSHFCPSLKKFHKKSFNQYTAFRV